MGQMADTSLELLQGTLDVLILKSLSWGPLHGYAVAENVRERSGQELKVEEGALYPALHRLEKRGLLEAEWGLSENNRRAKFYRLTTAGRAHLRAETQAWKRYAAAITRVLEAA
jgi:PadR family transcriptional regulator PadR